MPIRPQFIHEFRAKNDLVIRVRAMLPSDAPYLVDIFDHMSAESRYLRFNVPMQHPDPDWVRIQAERLSYLPPYEGRAWLAFADLPDAPETAVGGIRYMALTPDSAEVALVVRDDLQALGIGSSLIEFAAKKAYSEGYRKLVGIIQGANLPLWHSLKGLAIPMTTRRDGAATVIEVDLEEAVLLRWRTIEMGEPTDEDYDK